MMEKEGQGGVIAFMFSSWRAFVLAEHLCLSNGSQGEGHTY